MYTNIVVLNNIVEVILNIEYRESSFCPLSLLYITIHISDQNEKQIVFSVSVEVTYPHTSEI